MTNTLSLEESKPYYERYAVPGAGPILFEGTLANLDPRTASRVDFQTQRAAPMLFVGFGQDHVVPLSVTRAIVKKYRQSEAITEYVEFADRPHFPGVPGWGARRRSRPRLGCRPRHDAIASPRADAATIHHLEVGDSYRRAPCLVRGCGGCW